MRPPAVWPEALLVLSLPVLLGLAAIFRLQFALDLARALFWAGALALIAWRLAALSRGTTPERTGMSPKVTGLTPNYTVLAPLFAEAETAADLIGHLQSLDYPIDKLEIIALVHEHDEATAALVRKIADPRLKLLRVAADGRAEALNAGLSVARGTYLAVFDPEARPHPGQLREAADRFSTAPDSLACLQAPIRLCRAALGDKSLSALPNPTPGFAPTQLSAEYSVLYESTLPLLAKLGAPLPLGDGSTHYRTEALRRIGGWQAGHAAEDAEIAYRFARAGLVGGVLTLPTRRTAPADIHAVLPQKTRWLKGHLQTLAAHLAHPRGLGRLGALSLVATLGLNVASAVVQAPLMILVAALLLAQALQGVAPALPLAETLLVTASYLVAVRARQVAARHAGSSFGWRDAAFLPFYGALSTLAALHAAGEVLVAALRPRPAAERLGAPAATGETGRLAA